MRPRFEISHRADIQGLRAIAIALVVLAHAGVPGFDGGFIGVDVFFVLSGYLITRLLIHERLENGQIGYARFLARRLRRLLPALLVMLVVTQVAATFLLSDYEVRMQTGALAFALTWTSNFFFAFADFDYFAALKAQDLYLHTWSLGIEEQFYVIWPLLLMASLAWGSSIADCRRVLVVVLGSVLTVSLALCLYWSMAEPLLAFYMMPSRGWQFSAGALIFVVVCLYRDSDSGGKKDLARDRICLLGGVAGLTLIVGSAFTLHSELPYPSLYALLPTLGAAAMILGGTAQPSGLNHLLSSRPLNWLGDRSYSLYLWHWPILSLGDAYGLAADPAGVLFLVVLSAFIADLSYRYVERPFWKGQFSSAGVRPTILVALLSIVAAVGLSQTFRAVVKTDAALVVDARGGYNPRVDAPLIYSAGFDCDTGHFSAELKPCVAGDSDARHTAVLLGDSIGAQWVSLLPELFPAPEWQLTVLTKSACAIVDEEYYYDKAGGTYDVCTQWRNAALDYLTELQPDVVFVGSSSGYEFTESQWIDGTERVLDQLSAAAGNVIVIPGTPTLSFDGPSCLQEPYRFSSRISDSERECEEAMTSLRHEKVAKYLTVAAKEFSRVTLLNLNELVCPQRRCAAQRLDGLVVFRDQQHLTNSFVLGNTAEVHRQLKALELVPAALSKTSL